MVLKHNKRPFSSDESYQHASKHLRQLDCVGQLASFAEISSIRGIIPDASASGEGRKEIWGQPRGDASPGAEKNCEFSVIGQEFGQARSDLVANECSAISICDISTLLWSTNSSCEVGKSELGKCPLSDKSNQRAKPPSQWDQNCEQNSIAEIQLVSGNFEGSPISVAADEELENTRASALYEDCAESAHGRPSGLLSCSCISNEDVELEPLVQLSSFPGYFEDDFQKAGISRVEDVYSPIFDYPYRKLVAVGPNHQAEIPAWKSPGPKNYSVRSDNSVTSASSSVLCSVSGHSLNDGSEKWLGTCVIPMSNSGSSASEIRLQPRTDCTCVDEGSIRCVRQHVMEAREILRQTLGQDTFRELGFCDMGEDVARQWSEEEEQMFQEVVSSNPASLGKNFWNYLWQVFPSRSIKELVSYYFNVFMLRKRAEQNRLDPLNVDSDNDEWQASDDGESEEEEEEDSVVESPTHGDDVVYNDGQIMGIHEGSEDGFACDDSAADEEDREELCDVSEGCINGRAKNMQEHAEDHDVQDDSCTSYEGQHHGVDFCSGSADMLETRCGLADDRKGLVREYNNYGVSGLNDNSYDVSHCDLRTWDVSYLHGAENNIDFLPTCNVIEEVFGKGCREEAVDGHGVN